MLRFTFSFLVLILIIVAPCPAQVKAIPSADPDLAQRQLENVQIEEESIGALLSRFAFTYGIPIGLEVARNSDEIAAYRIDFKKGTLSDLLNQFVAEHKQYSWKIENGVLSVFPTDDYRDPIVKELLTTNVRSFSVKEKTSTWGFGQELIATPEIKRILKLRGVTCNTGYLGGFYLQQLGQQFTLNVSNVTLKSLLDQVVKKSPVAKYWSIANNNSAKQISLRVHADLEYPPKEAKTPE